MSLHYHDFVAHQSFRMIVIDAVWYKSIKSLLEVFRLLKWVQICQNSHLTGEKTVFSDVLSPCHEIQWSLPLSLSHSLSLLSLPPSWLVLVVSEACTSADCVCQNDRGKCQQSGLSQPQHWESHILSKNTIKHLRSFILINRIVISVWIRIILNSSFANALDRKHYHFVNVISKMAIN